MKKILKKILFKTLIILTLIIISPFVLVGCIYATLFNFKLLIHINTIINQLHFDYLLNN